MDTQDDPNDMKGLELESLKIQDFFLTRILHLMAMLFDSKGAKCLKQFLLKQVIKPYFSSDELCQIACTDNLDELLKICSRKKFNWFDGTFLTAFFQYLCNKGVGETEQMELWDQLCSYVKDFNRTKNTEKNGDVWLIDSELQKQLKEDKHTQKLRYFCAGVFKKSFHDFKMENEADMQASPITSGVVHSGKCGHSPFVDCTDSI